MVRSRRVAAAAPTEGARRATGVGAEGAVIPSCPLRTRAPRNGDEMPAMPGAPPILEQARDETVFVSPWLQIPVVFEHSKHVVDRPGADPHPGCRNTAARGGEPNTAAGGTSPYARRGADRGGKSPRARPGSQARSSRPRVSDRVSVVLTVPAQPAQEFVDILFSLRRDPMVVVIEHPADEDRKLVEREHHRPLVLRQGRPDRVALLPPASGVDPSPQLHAQFANGQRIDSIVDPAQDVGEPGLDSVPRTVNVP